MTKMKLITSNLFSPLILFVLINLITLVYALERFSVNSQLDNQSSILSLLTAILAFCGIANFSYYLYLRIKEKLILICLSKDAFSMFSGYVTITSSLIYLIVDHNDVAPFIIFLFMNVTNFFLLMTHHDITKTYTDEFKNNYKLLFMDSENIKWFLVFNKKMLNLKVKFNKDGVMVNNNYIEKENIKYYEDLFNKKIIDLNDDELTLIDMHEI
jgi:hypothetical protein